MFDSAEEQTAPVVFRKFVAQEDHRVSFTPILAIFPDLHGRATHLLGHFEQTRVVCVTTVTKEEFVVKRYQFHLELVKLWVCINGSVQVTKLVGNLNGCENLLTYWHRRFERHERIHYRIIDRIGIALLDLTAQRDCC